MTVTIPDYVQAQGNVKVVFTTTISDPPVSSDYTAATDLSCYLMPDWAGPSADQNSGTTARFCSTQTYQVPGRTTYALAELTYTIDPQGAGGNGNGSTVYDALSADTKGFVTIGYGIDPANDFAASDVVDVFPVTCGAQVKNVSGQDEFAPLTASQTLYVTGEVMQDQTLAS